MIFVFMRNGRSISMIFKLIIISYSYRAVKKYIVSLNTGIQNYIFKYKKEKTLEIYF